MGGGATQAPTLNHHIIAMPYPGRGHINPMMSLCKLLLTKQSNLTITFIITEEWFGFIGSAPKPPSITFKTIPNVIPSELIRASIFPEFVRAVFTKMEAPVEDVLNKIEGPPPRVMIADTYVPWAVELGKRRNIPVVSLWTMSPSVFSVFYHFDLLEKNKHFPVELAEQGDEVIDYIPGLSPTRLTDIASVLAGSAEKVLDDVLHAFACVRKAQSVMFTSFYELEHQLIDHLKATLPFPIYSVGPLIPHTKIDTTPDANLDYFKWLDTQPAKSVLYVSLGSFLSVSREQMDEIVEGVRESRVRCLWVARGDTSRIQEAVGDMGLVVPWCDQLRVLNHSSIGGFWTHCGWNSTLEGVFSGVPMLTFPIFFDQIPNMKLIADDWSVGMRVRQVRTETVVGSKQISTIVQKFMDLDAEEGKEMRRRSNELKKLCREALSKGGSSEVNLNDFAKGFLMCN